MLLYFLIFLQFILLLIALGMVIYMGLVMASFKNPIPYVPTPKKVIEKMIEVANIRPDDKVVDLGSGTGRIVFTIAKRNSARVIGLEKSVLLYFVSKFRLIFKRKRDRIKFIRCDFQDYPLNDIEVVLCFLTPEGIRMIEKKLRREMPQGSRLISYLFPLKEKEQFKESKMSVKDGKNKDYIFIYNKV